MNKESINEGIEGKSIMEEGMKTEAVQPEKENFFKKIWKGIKKPFGFIKRKTAPAMEFLGKGRFLAMILETVLAAQFWASTLEEQSLGKIPYVLCLLIMAAFWALFAELLNLVIKLLLGGGKRCKAYFLVSWSAVCAMNVVANQAEQIPGAVIMSFLLVFSVDLFGRVIWGFIRTRRFKQVTAYIALVLCVAYVSMFCFFYRTDSFGDSRVDFYNSIEGASVSTVAGFSDYLENGPYTVSTLSYGPEDTDDILTSTIDLTVFEQTKEAEDPITALVWLASDRDYSQTPIKGQIWYPEGQKGCPVFFIVHGNHDSATPSYLGYEFLGQYLASNGYAVISVDENIINELGAGNDLRAYVLLENMKALFSLSDSSDSPLSGLFDKERLAIGGHSRGGEMVATAYLFNDLDAYPEDGNIRFDYHFNITSIVAIAPVCDQYRPVGRSVEITDVNYLLIHGSNDQDVSSMMGEKQYNNITFTSETDELFVKSSVYILGANHGQFNSLWGQYDMAPMGKGYLNTNNFIDEGDQKKIAKAYIRTFLDSTVLGDDTYASLLSDVSSYEGDLPDTVYVTNYEDSSRVTLCSFDDTVDIVNSGNGTAVSVAGSSGWTYVPYDRGFGGESEEYVLSVNWDEESSPSVSFAFDDIDISEGAVSFAIADMREDTADMDSGLDYTVTLTDSHGNTISADCPVLVYHSFAVQLCKQDIFFGSYEYKHQLQTVIITPSMFGNSSSFDFTSVTGITITTDGTEEGSIIFDDVAYYSEY
ncbi:MAG: hypothetical protein K6E12_00345 [Saccharofermentans sp.]|nr:hypothetical protein [Saccharofermentans sp.]